jgi:hypothetical protein
MVVIDKLAGRPAIRFHIGNAKASGEASAVVPAGDDCDGLCAAGRTYPVKRKQDRWTIVKETMNWISWLG